VAQSSPLLTFAVVPACLTGQHPCSQDPESADWRLPPPRRLHAVGREPPAPFAHPARHPPSGRRRPPLPLRRAGQDRLDRRPIRHGPGELSGTFKASPRGIRECGQRRSQRHALLPLAKNHHRLAGRVSRRRCAQ
jgi:hypothetical protein